MSGNGFQRALAELLTTGQTRAQLDRRPAELAARFALTGAELGLLTAVDRGQLDIFVRSVNNKRLDMVARCLPATLSALSHRHDVFDDFLRRCPPLDAEGQQNHQRVLAEGSRFHGYLSRCLRHDLADLARYEVLRLELLFDPAATLAAEDAAPGTALGAHVRLAEFGHDVVRRHNTWLSTGVAPPEPSGGPIRIALVKLAGRQAVDCYRLGTRAYRILLSGELFGPDAAPVLRFARQQGLLRGTPEERCASAR